MPKTFAISPQEKKHLNGSALITILVMIAVALLVSSSAIVVAVTTSQVTSQATRSEQALAIAEAGVEESMLRLLRSPSYTGGTLTLDNGTATMTVGGTTTKTITSVGVVTGVERTIQATATLNGTVLSLTSWQEI
jgi:hypothetical protein